MSCEGPFAYSGPEEIALIGNIIQRLHRRTPCSATHVNSLSHTVTSLQQCNCSRHQQLINSRATLPAYLTYAIFLPSQNMSELYLRTCQIYISTCHQPGRTSGELALHIRTHHPSLPILAPLTSAQPCAQCGRFPRCVPLPMLPSSSRVVVLWKFSASSSVPAC